MAYYTGKDVKVWVLTEASTGGITLNSASKLEVTNNSGDASPATTNNAQEIYPFDSHAGLAGFELSDVTGVDLQYGAQDEEISFFGTKTPGKIETKKDMSVTITRKKSDKLWSVAAQGVCGSSSHSDGDGSHAAKHGLASATTISSGTTDPKSTVVGTAVVYGYRVFVQLKADSTGTANDGAVIALRNATYAEYTTTMSNDSANEETLNFVSMVEPLLLSGHKTSNKFTGGTTATTQTEM